jgi:hypothetical protein
MAVLLKIPKAQQEKEREKGKTEEKKKVNRGLWR